MLAVRRLLSTPSLVRPVVPLAARSELVRAAAPSFASRLSGLRALSAEASGASAAEGDEKPKPPKKPKASKDKDGPAAEDVPPGTLDVSVHEGRNVAELAAHMAQMVSRVPGRKPGPPS